MIESRPTLKSVKFDSNAPTSAQTESFISALYLSPSVTIFEEVNINAVDFSDDATCEGLASLIDQARAMTDLYMKN